MVSSAESVSSPAPNISSIDKIALENVSKSFTRESKTSSEQIEVFKGLDFAVQPGEFLTIIGPSGCGKTTLLRIMASLDFPDVGAVTIDETPIHQPTDERAVVFQSFGLFPWKTVMDNVIFPLQMRKVKKKEAQERAESFIERVGLRGFEQTYPRQLSGGMQQRVGLARALVCDPQILLMDEPFGALDAQTRELLQEELWRLVGEDRAKTVVFITHDLDEAVLLADRIVVLSNRPANVRETITVPLPHPRFSAESRSSTEFTKTRERIWKMLRGELDEDTTESVSWDS